MPSASPQLQPSLSLSHPPQPMPHPRVPSSPSHAILGTLSAQPPQALLEDDEEPMPPSSEIQPFSQVHTLLQSLQPRPSVPPPPQLQPLHMHAHSPAQVPSQLLSSVHMQAVTVPAPPPTQRHSSEHGGVRQPFTHSHPLAPSQQQKSMALQTKAPQLLQLQQPQLPQLQQQPPSPRSKAEAVPAGGADTPSGAVGFT